MKRLVKLLGITLVGMLVTFGCFGLAGYGQVKMVDVSSEPIYAGVLGKKVRLKLDVLALGFSSAFVSAPPIDYFALHPHRVGANRFILGEHKVKKGTNLEIVGVKDSKDWVATKLLGDRYTQYIVKVIGDDRFASKEVVVNLTGEGNDSNKGLDTNYYEVFRDSGSSRR